MNTTLSTPVRMNVEALIGVLDVDIQHLRQSLDHLDSLRSLVIKRDEAQLGTLLNTIRIESNTYQGNEHKRQCLRQALADLLDCPLSDLTLSRLEQHLPDPWPAALAQRRKTLRELTGSLRLEHRRTQWLLMDCARLNTLMLDVLLNQGREIPVTYTPGGKAQSHRENRLMNLQL